MPKWYSVISKRERWGFTWFGSLLTLVVLFTGVWVFLLRIVPFLSHGKAVDASVYVLEGYIEDYAYADILAEFERTKPDIIICTGTSFDQGFYITGIPSAAWLIANSLFALGVDSSLIHIVPVNPDVLVNRTYSSALMARKYLETNFPEVKSVNLFSTSVHARRSRYLFRKVFEPDFEFGNVVVHSHVYKYNNWYKSSRGFRAVLSETLAFLYVRAFFRPDVESDIVKLKLPSSETS
jgi:uncharacterized SAM-binding protein YcdF (DUF218 family)